MPSLPVQVEVVSETTGANFRSSLIVNVAEVGVECLEKTSDCADCAMLLTPQVVRPHDDQDGTPDDNHDHGYDQRETPEGFRDTPNVDVAGLRDTPNVDGVLYDTPRLQHREEETKYIRAPLSSSFFREQTDENGEQGGDPEEGNVQKKTRHTATFGNSEDDTSGYIDTEYSPEPAVRDCQNTPLQVARAMGGQTGGQMGQPEVDLKTPRYDIAPVGDSWISPSRVAMARNVSSQAAPTGGRTITKEIEVQLYESPEQRQTVSVATLMPNATVARVPVGNANVTKAPGVGQAALGAKGLAVQADRQTNSSFPMNSHAADIDSDVTKNVRRGEAVATPQVLNRGSPVPPARSQTRPASQPRPEPMSGVTPGARPEPMSAERMRSLNPNIALFPRRKDDSAKKMRSMVQKQEQAAKTLQKRLDVPKLEWQPQVKYVPQESDAILQIPQESAVENVIANAVTNPLIATAQMAKANNIPMAGPDPSGRLFPSTQTIPSAGLIPTAANLFLAKDATGAVTANAAVTADAIVQHKREMLARPNYNTSVPTGFERIPFNAEERREVGPQKHNYGDKLFPYNDKADIKGGGIGTGNLHSEKASGASTAPNASNRSTSLNLMHFHENLLRNVLTGGFSNPQALTLGSIPDIVQKDPFSHIKSGIQGNDTNCSINNSRAGNNNMANPNSGPNRNRISGQSMNSANRQSVNRLNANAARNLATLDENRPSLHSCIGPTLQQFANAEKNPFVADALTHRSASAPRGMPHVVRDVLPPRAGSPLFAGLLKGNDNVENAGTEVHGRQSVQQDVTNQRKSLLGNRKSTKEVEVQTGKDDDDVFLTSDFLDNCAKSAQRSLSLQPPGLQHVVQQQQMLRQQLVVAQQMQSLANQQKLREQQLIQAQKALQERAKGLAHIGSQERLISPMVLGRSPMLMGRGNGNDESIADSKDAAKVRHSSLDAPKRPQGQLKPQGELLRSTSGFIMNLPEDVLRKQNTLFPQHSFVDLGKMDLKGGNGTTSNTSDAFVGHRAPGRDNATGALGPVGNFNRTSQSPLPGNARPFANQTNRSMMVNLDTNTLANRLDRNLDRNNSLHSLNRSNLGRSMERTMTPTKMHFNLTPPSLRCPLINGPHLTRASPAILPFSQPSGSPGRFIQPSVSPSPFYRQIGSAAGPAVPNTGNNSQSPLGHPQHALPQQASPLGQARVLALQTNFVVNEIKANVQQQRRTQEMERRSVEVGSAELAGIGMEMQDRNVRQNQNRDVGQCQGMDQNQGADNGQIMCGTKTPPLTSKNIEKWNQMTTSAPRPFPPPDQTAFYTFESPFMGQNLGSPEYCCNDSVNQNLITTPLCRRPAAGEGFTERFTEPQQSQHDDFKSDLQRQEDTLPGGSHNMLGSENMPEHMLNNATGIGVLPTVAGGVHPPKPMHSRDKSQPLHQPLQAIDCGRNQGIPPQHANMMSNMADPQHDVNIPSNTSHPFRGPKGVQNQMQISFHSPNQVQTPERVANSVGGNASRSRPGAGVSGNTLASGILMSAGGKTKSLNLASPQIYGSQQSTTTLDPAAQRSRDLMSKRNLLNNQNYVDTQNLHPFGSADLGESHLTTVPSKDTVNVYEDVKEYPVEDFRHPAENIHPVARISANEVILGQNSLKLGHQRNNDNVHPRTIHEVNHVPRRGNERDDYHRGDRPPRGYVAQQQQARAHSLQHDQNAPHLAFVSSCPRTSRGDNHQSLATDQVSMNRISASRGSMQLSDNIRSPEASPEMLIPGYGTQKGQNHQDRLQQGQDVHNRAHEDRDQARQSRQTRQNRRQDLLQQVPQDHGTCEKVKGRFYQSHSSNSSNNGPSSGLKQRKKKRTQGNYREDQPDCREDQPDHVLQNYNAPDSNYPPERPSFSTMAQRSSIATEQRSFVAQHDPQGTQHTRSSMHRQSHQSGSGIQRQPPHSSPQPFLPDDRVQPGARRNLTPKLPSQNQQEIPSVEVTQVTSVTRQTSRPTPSLVQGPPGVVRRASSNSIITQDGISFTNVPEPKAVHTDIFKPKARISGNGPANTLLYRLHNILLEVDPFETLEVAQTYSRKWGDLYALTEAIAEASKLISTAANTGRMNQSSSVNTTQNLNGLAPECIKRIRVIQDTFTQKLQFSTRLLKQLQELQIKMDRYSGHFVNLERNKPSTSGTITRMSSRVSTMSPSKNTGSEMNLIPSRHSVKTPREDCQRPGNLATETFFLEVREALSETLRHSRNFNCNVIGSDLKVSMDVIKVLQNKVASNTFFSDCCSNIPSDIYLGRNIPAQVVKLFRLRTVYLRTLKKMCRENASVYDLREELTKKMRTLLTT